MIASFTYPEYLNEVADVIGRMRSESNEELRTLFPEFSRGTQDTKAHRKKSDVTHYAFIRIAAPNYAKMWVIKYDEVTRWEEKTAFTPFLFKKIYEPK